MMVSFKSRGKIRDPKGKYQENKDSMLSSIIHFLVIVLKAIIFVIE